MVTLATLHAESNSPWDKAFVPGPLPRVEYAEYFSAGRPTFSFEPIRAHDFEELQELLRDVRLKGDPSFKIYEHATIEPRNLPLRELMPLSLYLLNSQLSLQRRMFAHLMNHFHQNLYSLQGFIDYEHANAYYRMAPPIVETRFEPTLGKTVHVVIDGLHRLYTAKQLGLSNITVINISDVPERLPPVSLPVSWRELRVYDAVPHLTEKRRFRYKSPDEYPDLSGLTSVAVTQTNFVYFLYRDFDILGSSGIRRAPNQYGL